jgi:hypothetical protein
MQLCAHRTSQPIRRRYFFSAEHFRYSANYIARKCAGQISALLRIFGAANSQRANCGSLEIDPSREKDCGGYGSAELFFFMLACRSRQLNVCLPLDRPIRPKGQRWRGRKGQLEALKALFNENHDELCDALWKDLRRNVTDADQMDVA